MSAMFRYHRSNIDLEHVVARILTLENVYGTVVPRIGGVEHTYAKFQNSISLPLLDNDSVHSYQLCYCET